MDISKYIGKRVLLKLSSSGRFNYSSVEEYKILEVAPSGNWVKVMNLHGNKFWRAITEVSFVEELKDLKATKPL